MLRTHLIRKVALVGALAVMALPVFSATHHASACSNPGCIVQITGGSGVDFYISPLTATFNSLEFIEIQTNREPAPTQTVTTTGSAGFTVFDLRGNNQGYTAYLDCPQAQCFSSPQAPLGIPANDVAVAAGATTQGFLFYGDGIGRAVGAPAGSTGLSLNNFVEVGGECRAPVIGQGFYVHRVPLTLTLPSPYNEYGTLPVSFEGLFRVTIVENQNPTLCNS